MIHFAAAYITTERDGYDHDGYTSVCIELVLHAARRVYWGGTNGGARSSFTAQPKAPAHWDNDNDPQRAGAFGWAVNDGGATTMLIANDQYDR